MTAEMIVMNTGGIALAADSAITRKGRKMSETAEKLVGFSGNHAIGVLMYGVNAMFRMPWELLIKLYDNSLGGSPLATTEAYVAGLLRFLDDNPHETFMAEWNEKRHVERTYARAIDELQGRLAELHAISYDKVGELSAESACQKAYVRRADDFLNDRLAALESKPFPDGFGEVDFQPFIKEHEETMTAFINEAFANHLAVGQWLARMKRILFLSVAKEFATNISGIVFAGYGTADMLPSAHILIVDGKLNGKTKYFKRKRTLDHETNAIILPLAKRDAMKSFLNGIHEDTEQVIADTLGHDADALTHAVLDSLQDKLKRTADMEVIEKRVARALKQTADNYRQKLARCRRDNFSTPALDAVAHKTPRELAQIAKSFVDMQILKEELTDDHAEAGGPVDVALITKADGFNWVQRK